MVVQKGRKPNAYSLKPAADRLAELVSAPVTLASDVIESDEVTAQVAALQPGEILLLENVRFYKEEEGKGCTAEEQDAFAKQLAAFGDVYVSDAFGTARRAHASMVGVTKYIDQCAAGSCLKKKLNTWAKLLKHLKTVYWRLLVEQKYRVKSM